MGTGNLARDVAEAAPGAAVVRAFNTIPFELIAPVAGSATSRSISSVPPASPRIGDEQVDLLCAASESADAVAQQLIAECGLRPIRVDAVAQQLIAECGLRPIRAGDVEQAAHLDNLFALWARLAFAGGHGRRIAFALRHA